jgi:hypothetical protein
VGISLCHVSEVEWGQNLVAKNNCTAAALRTALAAQRRFDPRSRFCELMTHRSVMAAPIYYPNNSFHNADGNQFVDTTITAENVVFGG